MNRVLKVVFSRAKGMFVVVSELGRACTKGSLKSVLVAVPMALVATGAMADNTADIEAIKQRLAALENATATGKTNTAPIAIGVNATAMSEVSYGENSPVAMGTDSYSLGGGSVAIGLRAKSIGDGAIALGRNSIAYLAEFDSDGYFVWDGWDPKLAGSSDFSTAVGNQSWALNERTVALGAFSQALGEYSVALGAESVAIDSNTVSVGYYDPEYPEDYLYRRIVNVADGVNDTDAATVGQLKSLPANNYFSVNNTSVQKDEDSFSTSAWAVGAHSLAIGEIAHAYEQDSIAIGYMANASNIKSLAIGNGSEAGEKSVALGADSFVWGANSVALGVDSTVLPTESDVVSVGNSLDIPDAGFVPFTRRIINVSSGLNESDVSTVGQVSQALDSLESILGQGVTVQVNDGEFSINLDGGLGNTGKTTISEAIAAAAASGGVNWSEVASNAEAVAAIQAQARSAISLTSNDTDQITVTQNPSNSGQWLIDLTMANAISNGDSGLVTGSQMYSELRTNKGTEFTGNFLGSSKTTGENLQALSDGIVAINNSKANVDASNVGRGASTATATEDQATNAKKWASALGWGSIANGDDVLVTAAAVKAEVRLTTNGKYAQTDKSAAENLLALDTALYGVARNPTTSNIDLVKWRGILGGSSISTEDAGLGFITGNQLYTELRPANGNYIRQANTTAQNLSVLDTNVKRNAGAISSLDDRVTVTESDITALDGRVTVTESSITALDGRVTATESDITTLNGRVTATESDITTLVDRVTVTESDITALDGRVTVTESSITALDGRVTATESSITALDGRVTATESSITALDGRVTATESSITALDGRVTATESGITALDGRVTSVESSLTTNTADIAALDGRVTATESGITALDGRVNTNESDISQLKGKVSDNAGKIASNETAIQTNAGKIAVNEGKIAANKADIAQNKTDIATNKADIAMNKAAIQTNAGKIAVNEGKIADNASAIQANTAMIGQNASNIQTLNQRVNKVHDKVQRVGAGAAALAALRPQDFSADHPVSGAVGLGHYDGKQAIAVGMFYRPTENLTLGFGASAAGNDDYMMNAGISYRFGGGGSYTAISQSDINRKVVDLTDQNRALVAQIESSNIREEASAKRLNRVQKELKAAQKKAELSDQKLDMVMKELAALREEIQKMKQK